MTLTTTEQSLRPLKVLIRSPLAPDARKWIANQKQSLALVIFRLKHDPLLLW